MNRAASILLIVLVVGAVAFGAWQYSDKQRSASENANLKQQLDETAKQLATTQTERDQLREELAATNQKVKELEANITALRAQLEEKALRNGAITVPLTFVWNPANSIDVSYLYAIVRWMNVVQWRDSKIYFFIDHLGPQDIVPKMFDCDGAIQDGGPPSFGAEIVRLYPENDIPISITRIPRPTGGLWFFGCAFRSVPVVSIVVDLERFEQGTAHEVPAYGASIVTHELAHIFGIGEAVEHLDQNNLVIPVAWFGAIRVAASKFQMPIPSESSASSGKR